MTDAATSPTADATTRTHRRDTRPRGWFGAAALTVTAMAGALGCKSPPAQAPAPAPAAVPAEAPLAEEPSPVAAPVAAPAAAAAPEPTPDVRANAWGIQHAPATVAAGDRVYVLTKGKDRSMTDPKAVYQLFAHDVASVDGDIVHVAEIGGGSFPIAATFVVRAGVGQAKALSVGDAVLAEWASSLKHAVVEAFEGPADAPTKVRIRYTDLPESWPDDKVVASRTLRELTRLPPGLAPGNFAMVDDDGRDALVLLLASTPQGWLAQRFGGRVALFAADKLTALPHRPKLAKGDRVRLPWVGMMVPGKVVRISGTWVYARVEGIGQKEPISAALGQVLPEAALAERKAGD